GVLIPHLSRALGIMFRLRDAELKVASSRAALDRLESGVVLIGAKRSAVFANRTAQRLLTQAEGLRLRADMRGASYLVADRPEIQAAFDRALDQCLDPEALEVAHFSKALRIDRPAGSLLLQCSALTPDAQFGTGADRPRAIVFISDPATRLRLDPALMKQLY